MIRTHSFQLSLACALLAAATPLSAMAQDTAPIKIGLVSSQSGVFAQQGEEVIRGIKFAAEEANASGGVDGRKIEIQQGDDESMPDAGRREAEKLARNGYNLLIGAIPSSTSMAIAQSLERWDAAYFAVASKSDKLTGDTCRPRSFRTVQSDSMDIAMINEWVKTFKENSFAVLAADYAWGHDSGESFKRAAEAAGKKVPLSLYVPMGTKDFSPYIAQLQAANVDAIWVAEVGQDAITFIKQAGEFKLIPKTKIIGHALIMNFVVNATGTTLDGTIGNTAYTPDIDSPLNRKFVADWKAKFHRLPTDNEGQAYNGAQVIFDGVRLAKSVKPADVSRALRGAEIDTVYGKVTMRAADNQLVLPSYAGRVKTVDGVLRPAVEQVFPATLTPPPSPLCKM